MCQTDIVPESLQEFFVRNPKVAVAFSGGTDSSYLLYAAVNSGADAVAVFVSTPFQFPGEREDAERIAKGIGAEFRVAEAELMNDPDIVSNTPERCYFCKRRILGALTGIVEKDRILIDGTNASDDPDDRPGTRALAEFGVQSPLRLCGIGKTEVRELSRRAGLSTWNRPSNSCLATRIPAGVRLDQNLLDTVNDCEEALRSMGFSDFRVRTNGWDAVLETVREQRPLLESHKTEVESILLKYHSTVSYRERRPRL